MDKLKASIPPLVALVALAVLGGLSWLLYEMITDDKVGLGLLGVLIPLLLVVLFILFGLGRLLLKIRNNRAELLKGSIPPLLFLFALAWSIDLIIYLIGKISESRGEVDWALVEITLTLVLVFGLPWLLPTIWRGTEWLWWRFFALGGSWGADRVRNYALNDFELSIRQWKTDQGLEHLLAAFLP